MDNKHKEIINAITAYGANMSRWPEDLAKKASKTFEKNPQLLALLEDAKKTDALLENYIITDASIDNLKARIITEAKNTPQIRKEHRTYTNIISSLWKKMPSMQIFAPSGGLLAVAILGIWLNFGNATHNQQMTPSDELLLEAAIYEELIAEDTDDDLLWYITEGRLTQ